MNIFLTPETVAMYKDFITEPQKHNLGFKPLQECFQASDTATAQDELFDQYLVYIQHRPLPKMIFYIIMAEIYGQPVHKDAKGKLGFRLTFNV